jgi:tryptophanyl-tRNA synthetase
VDCWTKGLLSTVILKKFKKAVTDSGCEIKFDPENKPGISNLINIYGAVKGLTTADVEKEFEGSRYGDFKIAVGTAVAEELAPIKAKYDEFLKDKEYLNKILIKNAEIAREAASKTLKEVYKKVGFVQV